MRRILLVVASLSLLGSVPIVANAAHAAGQAGRGSVTVKIVGTETFKPNGEMSTYRFPDAPIKVNQGGFITFDNQTNDGHTITLVSAADVPKSFNCPVCNDVNNVYFPGNGPPAGFNIDNGLINDDESQFDADALDGNGVPIEDFDTVSHSNGQSSTIGDSTLVDANGSNNGGGPTQRTVQVTASPGTYNIICTFHPWMHGTIVVG
jgi:plastocyanin